MDAEELKTAHIVEQEKRNQAILRRTCEESTTKKAFKRMYADQIRGEEKPKHRGVRFTTHAFQRFAERMALCGYSIPQIRNDIKRGRRKARGAGNGTFQILGSLGVYVIAKDRISHDRIVLTMHLTKGKKSELGILD